MKYFIYFIFRFRARPPMLCRIFQSLTLTSSKSTLAEMIYFPQNNYIFSFTGILSFKIVKFYKKENGF